MANFKLDRYNVFLENAEKIYDYLSGNYMNAYEGRLLDCGELERTIAGMKIIEVYKYRKMGAETNFHKIKTAVSKALSAYHRSGCGAAYFIVSKNSEISLYFASEIEDYFGFDTALKGAVPEIGLKNSSFLSRRELVELAEYGGIVTGAFDLNEQVLDGILAEMNGTDSIIGILALPLSGQYSKDYQMALRSLSEQAEAVANAYDTSGNGSCSQIGQSFPEISRLNACLEEKRKRFFEHGDDMWKMCIWFGSSKKWHASALGAKLSGTLTAADSGNGERGRYYRTTENPFQFGMLSFPNADYGEAVFGLEPVLRKSALVSIVTTKELAGLMQLPERSHAGFEVIDTNINADSYYEFSVNMPLVSNHSIVIGNEAQTGREYALEMNQFCQHALITGGTGSGKSNTVKLLLENFYNKKIPFCVIEPAKKEYYQLTETITNLKVFSSGGDALPLRLNPLEPEEGVTIGNHIEELMYAFTGAFEMEEAVKRTLEGLIKYTYEKQNWKLTETAYKKRKRYPQISDLLQNMSEYSETEIHSGSEVRQNIEGAVYRRLDYLKDGILGELVNTKSSITGRELCSGSVLIELDDLAISAKPFVMNLLLIKMNQFLRQQNSLHELKNVIVIEEAHNIFEDTSGRVTSPKTIASEYLSNLLSEICAYGTGLIIVDQGASRIHPNAVANTSIKIAHALAALEDVNREAFSLNINEFQKRVFLSLKTGESIVAVRGEEQVCKVKIKKAKTGELSNLACLFCENRRFCEFEELSNLLERTSRSEFLMAKVYQSRWEAELFKKDVDSYLDALGISDDEKACAFGYLLTNTTMPCGEREKRRILYRYVMEAERYE